MARLTFRFTAAILIFSSHWALATGSKPSVTMSDFEGTYKFEKNSPDNYMCSFTTPPTLKIKVSRVNTAKGWVQLGQLTLCQRDFGCHPWQTGGFESFAYLDGKWNSKFYFNEEWNLSFQASNVRERVTLRGNTLKWEEKESGVIFAIIPHFNSWYVSATLDQSRDFLFLVDGTNKFGDRCMFRRVR